MTDQRTLTLDGVTHEVEKFSQGVQSAVNVYNAINADLQKEQMAVIKSQAALQAIGAQIAEAVKKELADMEAAAAATTASSDAASSTEP